MNKGYSVPCSDDPDNGEHMGTVMCDEKAINECGLRSFDTACSNMRYMCQFVKSKYRVSLF